MSAKHRHGSIIFGVILGMTLLLILLGNGAASRALPLDRPPGQSAQPGTKDDPHNNGIVNSAPAAVDAFHLINPCNISVTQGTTFTLDLLVNAGTNVDLVAQQAYLTFTNSLLQVVTTGGGCAALATGLQSDTTTFDSVFQNVVSNTAGTIAFASGALSNPPAGGVFRVARIHFCATGTGSAQINWQFSPPAPPQRNTGITNEAAQRVENRALYSNCKITIVGGVTPTPTTTNTPVPPTATNTTVPATATNTTVPATATRTNTAVPPTATNTTVPATATNTTVPATATRTNTAVPPTATNTTVPATATNTTVPATATRTNTAVAATATNTPPPQATATRTNTAVPATATRTVAAPTATRTVVAPTATATLPPPPPTATPTLPPPPPTATGTVCPTGTPTRVATPAYTPAPGCNPTPRRHDLRATITDHPTFTEARFTNRSSTCSYPIGLATYMRFGNNIDNQVLYDYTLAVIPPNSSLTLQVNNPPCKYQGDAFWGSLIESFAGGQRYNERRLDDTDGVNRNRCVRCGDSSLGIDLVTSLNSNR